MRKLIALALVLAGASFAGVPGWSQGLLSYYYVQDGCGADAGKRVLVIGINGVGLTHVVKSTDANYAEVLEATQFAFRNGKQIQLMTAPTTPSGSYPITVSYQGLMDNGTCPTQSGNKVNAYASK